MRFLYKCIKEELSKYDALIEEELAMLEGYNEYISKQEVKELIRTSVTKIIHRFVTFYNQEQQAIKKVNTQRNYINQKFVNEENKK